MVSIQTRVTEHLDRMGIIYKLFQHPSPIHSLEQAAQERAQQPSQVIRSILFRITKDEYAMVLVAGPQQISWKELRKFFGQSRLTMATPEEVLQVTGYEPGTVSPFGFSYLVPVIVDQSVLQQSEVSLGSGKRGIAVIITIDELKRALGNYQLGNFCTGE